jgi:hypothetical protein
MMEEKKYKLIFEAVLPMGLGAKYYYGERPVCKPQDVTDESAWAKTEKITDDPWDQYNTLKEWEASGEHLIRNVRLFETSVEWKECKP